MAFYSDVGKDANKIERRENVHSIGSSPTCEPVGNRSRSTSPEKRHVKFACYTEMSGGDQSDISSLSLSMDRLQLTPTSISHSQSDIVPPLDLQWQDDNTARLDRTFSYRKDCKNIDCALKADHAYKIWLLAKKKLSSDEALRKKKAEEQKRQENEERKRLADQKYQEWVMRKSCEQARSRETIKNSQEQLTPKSSKMQKPQLSDAQAKLEKWMQAKQAQEDRRRAIMRQKEQRRREEQQQRRQMSADAWNRWLAQADKKPKPVPLNQGILSLRGTVSDIYINPNKWKGPTDVEDEN